MPHGRLRAGSLVWGICARQSWRRKPRSAKRRAKRAGERNGARKSEPARKPLNFEFRPCEVTSLNCQGIKYLTNTSEAKCKTNTTMASRHCQRLSTCTGPNSFQYHRKICMVSFGNVWSSYKNYMVSFRNAWSSPGKLWLSCFRKVSVFASEFSFSR